MSESKSEPLTDLLGYEVKVGSRIVYAAVDGYSAGLRVGKVIEIVEPKPKEYGFQEPVKLRVEVETHTGYGKINRPTLIQASFKRFVVI